MKFMPLSTGFMLASILGFLFSVFYVYSRSPKFGSAFAVVFFLMFIAAMLSMTHAETPEHLTEKGRKPKAAGRKQTVRRKLVATRRKKK